MKNNFPFISIIIPSRNEEKFIGRCLDSLIKNNYPKERIEILVMDGRSTDQTREIIKNYSEKYSFIKFKDNPALFQPFALNKGIKESRGEIIIRCDAHAKYCQNYVKKLVFWLQKNKKIGNVGGVWVNEPGNNTSKAKGIAFALSHPFCVGVNKYRVGAKKPTFVDTVPFGAWRREIFDELGYFDTNFLRAEDLDFNMRLKKAGYKILLDPDIKITYYPRDSFQKLFSMFFQYAYWKLVIIKKLKTIPSLRQFVPPLFILYLFLAMIFSFLTLLILLPLILYLVLILMFSFQISFQKKDIKILPFSFWTFVVSHIGYGLAYWNGIWNIFIKRTKNFNKRYSKITR